MTNLDKSQWVQSTSAFVATAMSLVSGTIGLLTIIPLGFISDRYGRRYALLIAFTGFIIEASMNAATMLLHLPLWVLIVATLPTSIFGNGVAGVLTQLYVCITDLTQSIAESREKRLSTRDSLITSVGDIHPRRVSIMQARLPTATATVQSSMASERLSLIALFEGCMGITLSIATMVMGPIIQHFGFVVCGWLIIIVTFLGAICCFLIPNTKLLWHRPGKPEAERLLPLKESDPDDRKLKISACAKLKQAFSFVSAPVIFGQLTLLVASIVSPTDIPIFNLFLIGLPFEMSSTQVGLSLGLRGIGSALVNGLFVLFNMLVLQPKLAVVAAAVPKGIVAENGLTVGAAGAAGKPYDEVTMRKTKLRQARKIMLYMLIIVLSVMTVSRFLYGLSGSFSPPACFGVLFLGRLFALLGFSEAFGTFIGATSLPMLFAVTVRIYVGFVFLLASALLFGGFLLAW
ncbi:unnamed protein product [Schistocephalus solidus]|uniref:MFS general substrate transporter n=1 Tax=Schistocephalus solidus TaxID=70667 RepID=A0A183SF31_SCHSO|nr:unnamed protein product [Schistocephalus solidus]